MGEKPSVTMMMATRSAMIEGICCLVRLKRFGKAMVAIIIKDEL